MSEKSIVDTKVMEILKNIGYSFDQFHYGYIIPSNGNNDIKPDKGKKYLSKNLKNTHMELEFCIFSQGKKSVEKNKRLIIIEDKKEEIHMGSYENMTDISGLYKYALTDLYHYSIELLTKTSSIKEIIGIAVAGENIVANAIYFYKDGAITDKYAQNVIRLFNDIKMIKLPSFKEWDRLSASKISKYVKSDILHLNSPESIENITHIKSVAAKLSKSIDVSLKLDPYKRLLLVCGLLIGIKQDDSIIYQFNDRKGTSLLYEAINEALPDSKFDFDKKKQLLRSFSFIKDEPELQTNVTDKKGKILGMPLKIISDELQIKSPIGYSIIDLMKESSHIDLLGNLFDVFTKYMSIGGSSGDIILTPNHLTKFMADIIDISPDENVLDITVGTGGFLIASLKIMENKIMSDETLSLSDKETKIKEVKEQNLWGVEFDANMFAACVSNMMLHGDGKSHIFRGNSRIGRELTGEKRKLTDIFSDIEFKKLLFNPPYENHLEYVRNGLEYIVKDGKAAIIIPKNTFNKCSDNLNSIKEDIFSNNKLIAVIDLPKGQFKIKSKTVGTDVAIFVFLTGHAHSFKEISLDEKSEIGDIVTFIKLKKDEVYSKGANRGLPSKTTLQIYKNLTEYIKTGFLDDSLLSNREYFEPVLKERIIKNKLMYKDYAPLPCITPIDKDFLEVIEKYLSFKLKENERSISLNDI